MCVVCVCLCVHRRAGALGVEKSVCVWVHMWLTCTVCIFVLAPQHVNGVVFACRVRSCLYEWMCLHWVRVVMQAHIPSYITDLGLMHGRAATHIYEFAFLRDTETLSEGFLVCSREDQTTLLQYGASSLYVHTFADGYCWLSLNWNVSN